MIREAIMQEALINWKKSLEKERDDILKKQGIIENRLNRNKLIWEITQEIDESKRGAITEGTKNGIANSQKELDQFRKANDPKLEEIAALLEVVERKLNS
jgi:hypothetical protein